MKYIIFSILLISQALAQPTSKHIPRWIVGTWEGKFGYEHDTIMYSSRITIDSNGVNNKIVLISENLSYECALDSIGENICRFKILDSPDTTMKFMQQTTFDLVRFADWPKDILHVELYAPYYQLWIGQLKKSKYIPAAP